MCFRSYSSVRSVNPFRVRFVETAAFVVQEEKIKEYRKEKRKDKKRKIEELAEDDAGPSDEMIAIMGFSGFGSKKK